MNISELPAHSQVAYRRAVELAAQCSKPVVTYTVVHAISHAPVPTTAPNGSSSGTDYRTTTISRQDWADLPENGIYAGKTYRITEVWMSSVEDGTGTIRYCSSSQPWPEGD